MDQEIKSTQEVKKTFTYSAGDVSLAFTLRIDSSEQLDAFYGLLAQAQRDVAAELEAFEEESES